MVTRHGTFILGVLSGYASNVILIVMGIVAIPIGLNYFGSARYGVWIVIVSMLTYLNASQFGVGTATSTLIAKAPRRTEQQAILSSSIALLVISSLFFLFLMLMAGKYPDGWSRIFGHIPSALKEETVAASLALAVLFLIRLPLIPFASAFAGLQQLHYERLYSVILPSLTNFMGLIAVIYFEGDLILLALLTGVGNILVALAGVAHIYWQHKDLRPKWPKDLSSSPITRQIIGSGGRFFIVSLAAMLVWNTDNLVISYFLGPEHVSAYAITFKLFTVAFSIYMVVNAALWPMYGKAASENNWTWINSIYSGIAAISPALGGLVWIGGILFAKDIIHLWTGLSGYGGMLVVFALGGYGYTVSLNNMHANLLGGLNIVILWLGLFEAALNLVLSLLLVRYFGIGGVALGTFLSALLSVTWVLPLYVHRKTQGKVRMDWLPIIRHALSVVAPFVIAALLLDQATFQSWLGLFLKLLMVLLYILLSWKILPLSAAEQVRGLFMSVLLKRSSA